MPIRFCNWERAKNEQMLWPGAQKALAAPEEGKCN